jgi:hypothetical protein
MRDFAKGATLPALLQAVCAAGAVFISRSPEDNALQQSWLQKAEDYVLKRIDDTSLANIQVLLLLTFSHNASRKFKKGMTLLSIASRMAYIGRLNYEGHDMPFMLKESRRRVMWGLYMQDTFYAGGLPEFTTCSVGNHHLKLPSTEINFEMDIEADSETLHPDRSATNASDLGIIAYFIRVLDIRDRILR